MPQAVEAHLRDAAAAAGKTGADAARYIYGAMNNLGLMRGNKVTAKGRASERTYGPPAKPAPKERDYRYQGGQRVPEMVTGARG